MMPGHYFASTPWVWVHPCRTCIYLIKYGYRLRMFLSFLKKFIQGNFSYKEFLKRSQHRKYKVLKTSRKSVFLVSLYPAPASLNSVGKAPAHCAIPPLPLERIRSQLNKLGCKAEGNSSFTWQTAAVLNLQVATALGLFNGPFTGVAHQILILQFTTVAKLKL